MTNFASTLPSRKNDAGPGQAKKKQKQEKQR